MSESSERVEAGSEDGNPESAAEWYRLGPSRSIPSQVSPLHPIWRDFTISTFQKRRQGLTELLTHPVDGEVETHPKA